MPGNSKTVMGWVLVVAIISFILLIMVIIFGNLSGNMGFKQVTKTTVIINGSTTGTVNETGTTFGNFTLESSVCTVNAVTLGNGTVISSGNYTVTSSTCTIALTGDDASDLNNSLWYINSTTNYKQDSTSDVNAEEIISNYTSSATNVATQFPTVGTITGVAVLLLILIGLLIYSIKKMMGVTSVVGSKSSNFSGSSRRYS